MVELLRFLFIAILILYIIRNVARIFLPFLFQSVVNKAQQGRPQEHQQQQTNYSQPKKEGPIKVDYIPKGKRNTVPDNEGEFIDYEEIK